MSLREQITTTLVTRFQEIEDPLIALATREPIDVEKLAITQFPAILVTFAVETRETVTMGMSGIGQRMGELAFDLRGFVRGAELDQKRNDLIEAIEEQLELDRYLGLANSGVLDSQITEIEVIPRLAPLAEVRLRLVVRYSYMRGAT
jgi:hypothetical protein